MKWPKEICNSWQHRYWNPAKLSNAATMLQNTGIKILWLEMSTERQKEIIPDPLINYGMMKYFPNMGISTLTSRKGAQIFPNLGPFIRAHEICIDASKSKNPKDGPPQNATTTANAIDILSAKDEKGNSSGRQDNNGQSSSNDHACCYAITCIFKKAHALT
ncbi:NADH-dependent glutamate synthase 1 [Melia azedarach]|uniref:NADH-dependent glutamate synthase 1 n=1 Tax=Melia azedarach TaxID=155640 RepID=A0ACC1YJH4_MELAZ|nr:NADH-dependent glutamate synthase 1 [Melia azedarach]